MLNDKFFYSFTASKKVSGNQHNNIQHSNKKIKNSVLSEVLINAKCCSAECCLLSHFEYDN